MIDAIWNKIINNEGKLFHTIRGLPFTYKIEGDFLTTTRTNYPLSKSEFEKAMKHMPLSGPGQINKIVRGPAYVYAILTDSRIK